MTDQPKVNAPKPAAARPAVSETRRAAAPRPANPATRVPEPRRTPGTAETRRAASPPAKKAASDHRPAKKTAESKAAGRPAEATAAGAPRPAKKAAEARRTSDASPPREAKKAATAQKRQPDARPAKKVAEAKRATQSAANTAADRSSARKATDPSTPPKDNKPGGADAQGSQTPTIERINGKRPFNSDYAGRKFDGKTWTPDLDRKYPNGVNFSTDGFPNFTPYTKAKAEIPNLSGKRSSDEKLANKAVGLKETPKGYTWHHHQDGKTMQLIPSDVHNGVRHTGGAAIIKDRKRKAQDS